MQSAAAGLTLSFLKRNRALLNPTFTHRFASSTWSRSFRFTRGFADFSKPDQDLHSSASPRGQSFYSVEGADKSMSSLKDLQSSSSCPPPASSTLRKQWFLGDPGRSRDQSGVLDSRFPSPEEELMMKKKFEEWAVESGEDESIVNTFKEWMLEHGRVYKDANEMQNRYLVFKYKFPHFKMQSRFADMSHKELPSLFGFHPRFDPIPLSYLPAIASVAAKGDKASSSS